ncbi:MAG: helix-turn-helix transcriptional regulator [Tidjanibacter sp.]|nr:helix-turn-helix transcriptional regulator [Tidjanibacter sp.]
MTNQDDPNSPLDEHLYKVATQGVYSKKSIEQLAEECCLCTTTFKLKFRCLFGESVHRWMVRKRLEYAKRLLCGSNLSVKAIAYTTLFSTPSHFIRLFKEHFGSTPTDYRKAHRWDREEMCRPQGCSSCEATNGTCCCRNIRTGQCPNLRTKSAQQTPSARAKGENV